MVVHLIIFMDEALFLIRDVKSWHEGGFSNIFAIDGYIYFKFWSFSSCSNLLKMSSQVEQSLSKDSSESMWEVQNGKKARFS
jgi:hypothetical protein